MLGRKGFSYRLLASILVVLLSPFIFIALPTRLAFNEWFIEWEYSKADFPKDRYGMEDSHRKRLAKLGLKAVLSEEGMEEFKRAKLPDGRPAFTAREVKHMEDVRRLLSVVFPALYVAIPVWGLALISLRDTGLIGKTLIASSLFSIFLVTAITVFSITNYELAFEVFHNYVFDPSSWRFRYTDTLLRIYPMKFWYDGTLFVICSAGLLALLSFALGLFMLRCRR